LFLFLALIEIPVSSASESATDPGFAEQTTPLYSALQLAPKYTTELRVEGIHDINICIFDSKKLLVSFRGHPHTVFTIAEGILYYAKYSGISPGGHIVAINLASGKQLWEVALESLATGRTSAYHETMTIKIDANFLQVHVKEDAGEYIDSLDMSNGKKIGRRIISGISPGGPTN
jgi:hypothetical protein